MPGRVLSNRIEFFRREVNVGDAMVIGVVLLALMLSVLIPLYRRGSSHVPLSYRYGPYEVQDGGLHPGDPIIVSIERCNDSDKPIVYTFSRTLVSTKRTGAEISSVVTLAGGPSVADPGCQKVGEEVGRVPAKLADGTVPNGEYRVRSVAILTGSGDAFFVGWESEPFRIVP